MDLYPIFRENSRKSCVVLQGAFIVCEVQGNRVRRHRIRRTIGEGCQRGLWHQAKRQGQKQAKRAEPFCNPGSGREMTRIQTCLVAATDPGRAAVPKLNHDQSVFKLPIAQEGNAHARNKLHPPLDFEKFQNKYNLQIDICELPIDAR
ncbi:hypothetical protein MHM88_15145 [Epibacterium sp. MM17-32]|uniref:hypothetical protein n=1 Tax=Epibacterium sp. MM17-32 TaxID=2917734 RepID=UPI001EF63EED|nr:hypothetical protein [Epibacterium sp. MM17-32]MCG7629145.1 hypothetical protein [Epibacterium sp. MM17-32]